MFANFEHPCMNWDAKDTYQEYRRFRQHCEFTFKGPLCKAADKDKAGWLGMWIGQQGRESYKTFTWEENEEDDPKVVLDKKEMYVRQRKNKRVAGFRAQQRQQAQGEPFDNFVKNLKVIINGL